MFSFLAYPVVSWSIIISFELHTNSHWKKLATLSDIERKREKEKRGLLARVVMRESVGEYVRVQCAQREARRDAPGKRKTWSMPVGCEGVPGAGGARDKWTSRVYRPRLPAGKKKLRCVYVTFSFRLWILLSETSSTKVSRPLRARLVLTARRKLSLWSFLRPYSPVLYAFRWARAPYLAIENQLADLIRRRLCSGN